MSLEEVKVRLRALACLPVPQIRKETVRDALAAIEALEQRAAKEWSAEIETHAGSMGDIADLQAKLARSEARERELREAVRLVAQEIRVASRRGDIGYEGFADALDHALTSHEGDEHG